MTYDPHAVDSYAVHLTAVNNTRQVVASEDIYNSKGVLLLKKGQSISRTAVERIVSFKLIKPIERSVEIEGALTAQRVLCDIQAALPDTESRRMHDQYNLDSEIKRAGGVLQRFPFLRQKLTVLALQAPREYRKALWGVWLGMIVGRKLGLSEHERDEVFLAAMIRDLGMLHIDPAIVGKVGELTPEEWRTVQSHVVIGKLIAEQMEDMPMNVVRAVAEHHEVCDGTGYLSGAAMNELCLLGQIVSVIDSMTAVLLQLKARGRWTRDVLPILHLNRYVHHPEVCSALIETAKEHGYSEAALVTDEKIGDLVQSILRDRISLVGYANQVRALVQRLPPSEKRIVESVRRVDRLLTHAIHSSGALEEGYVNWASAVAAQKQQNAYREIEDTRLMLDEVRWQLSKLTRLLQEIAHDDGAVEPAARHALAESLKQLPVLLRAPAETLQAA